VQRWLSVAASELYRGPATARGYALFRRKAVPQEVTETAHALFTLLERHLAGQQYLAGDAPTLADLAIYSYTALAPEGGLSLEPYPHLRAWLARIEALPGFVPVVRTPLPDPAPATTA